MQGVNCIQEFLNCRHQPVSNLSRSHILWKTIKEGGRTQTIALGEASLNKIVRKAGGVNFIFKKSGFHFGNFQTGGGRGPKYSNAYLSKVAFTHPK